MLAAAGTSAAIAWRASSSTIDAGFWWDDAPFAVSADDAVKIGGPITADELTRIQGLSRGEVERAYQDLRVTVTDHHDAFWRISVIARVLLEPSVRLANLTFWFRPPYW